MPFFKRNIQSGSEERAKQVISTSSLIKPGYFLSGDSTKKYSSEKANVLWNKNYPKNQKVTCAYNLGIAKHTTKALDDNVSHYRCR